MMNRLSELEKYIYYFQFTLTAYDRDVEPNLPSKNESLIPAFQQLSRAIGRNRVIWRYDPIFFNDRYTLDYHCKYFRVLAAKLSDYTEKCTVTEQLIKILSSTIIGFAQINIIKNGI